MALRLQEYRFRPVYIKLEINIADIFSRLITSIGINQIEIPSRTPRERIDIKEDTKIPGLRSLNNMNFLMEKIV